MWDVDDSGSINVTEMTNIIATMDDVEGVEQEPKVTQKIYTPCNMLHNLIITIFLLSARSIVLKTQC